MTKRALQICSGIVADFVAPRSTAVRATWRIHLDPPAAVGALPFAAAHLLPLKFAPPISVLVHALRGQSSELGPTAATDFRPHRRPASNANSVADESAIRWRGTSHMNGWRTLLQYFP